MRKFITALAMPLGLPGLAMAAPAPEDPAKQTSWGLYLTAKEAEEMKTLRPDEVFFIDVRDPVEIMFAGFTDVVVVNVAFLLADPPTLVPGHPQRGRGRSKIIDFHDKSHEQIQFPKCLSGA